MNITEQTYGEWIESLAEWDWFATFTFRYETSPRAANRLWRKWLRSLERTVNGQVHFVRVLEEGNDNQHYHCLLAGVKDQKPSVWERAWYSLAGIAKIEPYIASGGGAHYIGNKVYRGCEVAWSKNLSKARVPEYELVT